MTNNKREDLSIQVTYVDPLSYDGNKYHYYKRNLIPEISIRKLGNSEVRKAGLGNSKLSLNLKIEPNFSFEESNLNFLTRQEHVRMKSIRFQLA